MLRSRRRPSCGIGFRSPARLLPGLTEDRPDGWQAEARAYLAHPVLGARLRECAEVLAAGGSGDPVAVFGSVDAQKLRSSMTLFAVAAPEEPVFQAVLDGWFGGQTDDLTDGILRRTGGGQ